MAKRVNTVRSSHRYAGTEHVSTLLAAQLRRLASVVGEAE